MTQLPKWLLPALLMISPMAWSAIDAYEFSDEKNRELFQELTAELRCPKCQNQNLADSNSPIASDMRREIYRMLEEGQNGEQVVDFMVDRYGDFVRYRPKRDDSTWVLWYGPIVLIVLGVVVVVLIASRRKSAVKAEPQRQSDNRDKLNKILDEYNDKESS